MVNLTQKLTSLIWSYWLYGQFSLDKTADHITDLHCIFILDTPITIVSFYTDKKISMSNCISYEIPAGSNNSHLKMKRVLWSAHCLPNVTRP